MQQRASLVSFPASTLCLAEEAALRFRQGDVSPARLSGTVSRSGCVWNMENLGYLEDYIVWMGCSSTSSITSATARGVAVGLLSMHGGVNCSHYRNCFRRSPRSSRSRRSSSTSSISISSTTIVVVVVGVGVGAGAGAGAGAGVGQEQEQE